MLYLHSNAVEKNTEKSNFEDLEMLQKLSRIFRWHQS